MAEMKRRYVYEVTFEEVQEFARRENIRSPNFKFNFPFYLEQYIKHLKFWKR